jgi:hypothetical protein
MIEMAVGKDHLFDGPFSHTGINSAHLIDNTLVHARVDEGVYIIEGVPIAAHEIRIGAVCGLILCESCYPHLVGLSPFPIH